MSISFGARLAIPWVAGLGRKSPGSSGLERGGAAGVANRDELARREAGELAELRRHVRLVVVAGVERDRRERGGLAVEQVQRSPEADDARVHLRHHADLVAKDAGEAGL